MAEESEKRTPVFDWEIGDFKTDPQGRIVTVTEQEAVEQIAIKAVNTVRGVFLIYGNVDDEDLDHKYGSDVQNVLRAPISEDLRLEELKRAVREALIYDPWVEDVYDVEVTREGVEPDAGYVDLKIRTIFNTEIPLERVTV
jgi:hypothetical protein